MTPNCFRTICAQTTRIEKASKPCIKRNMKTNKSFWPALYAIAGLTLIPPLTSAAKEPASGLDLVRELNRAFIEVAEKVSPVVVVVNVTQKPETMKFEEDQRNPLEL